VQIDHRVQLLILKELLFNPKARFAQLNKTKLTNDHFTFHIKHLVKKGLIEKKDSIYQLTSSGLLVAGKLDLKSLKFVNQPKVGVLVCVTRQKEGKVEVLLGKRRRDPGKGKFGFYARKVRFGESLYETAKRCLEEETGLRAKYDYSGTVRILDKKDDDSEFDRLMIYLKSKEFSGDLKRKTVHSANSWISYSEAYKIKDVFADFNSDLDLFKKKENFFEERYI
jgi:ADP-ribose pyrophosphatase YjhB (NUDIX family)